MTPSARSHREEIAEILLRAESDEQVAGGDRLAAILRSSPEAMVAYLQHMELLAGLHFAGNGISLAAGGHQPVTDVHEPTSNEGSIGHERAAVLLSQSTIGSNRVHSRRYLSPRWIAAAASLLLVAYFVGVLSFLAIGRNRQLTDKSAHNVTAQSTRSPTDPLRPESRATITTQQDCKFVAKAPMLRVGESIQDELIALKSGILELRFVDGATVRLEGPCEFSASSGSRGKLQAGKLVASVPTKAIGFTVETPEAEFVDLGTEFGVRVDEDGTAEATVFRGCIEARVIAIVAQNTPVRVSAGESVKLPRGSSQFSTSVDPDDGLVRLATPVKPSINAPPAEGTLRITAQESFAYPAEQHLHSVRGESEFSFGWAGPWAAVNGVSPLVFEKGLPRPETKWTVQTGMASDLTVPRAPGSASVNGIRPLALTYRRGTVEMAFALRTRQSDDSAKSVCTGLILKEGADFRLFIGNPRERETFSLFANKANADTAVECRPEVVYFLTTTIEHRPGEKNDSATLRILDETGKPVGNAATVNGQNLDFNHIELVLDESSIDEISVSTTAAPKAAPRSQPSGGQ